MQTIDEKIADMQQVEISKDVLPPTPYQWKPPPPKEEWPDRWKENIPHKHLKIAIADQHILLGWTLEDYLYYASLYGKYELVSVWGIQGSGKSDDMLRMLYWIYQDWDEVLKHIVFRPSDFTHLLKQVPKGFRIPALGWDDIAVHYPSSSFRTNIKQYEAVDSAFAAIRVKCPVIVTTIPVIDRLAKNVKDNISFEVYLGRNQNERIFRIFRLPNFRAMKSNLFKILIEDPKPFDLLEVPTPVYRRYEEERLTLTEEALERLDRTVEPGDSPDGYISVIECAEKAMKAKVKYGVGTIQQDASRGIMAHTKFQDYLYIKEEDFDRVLASKKGMKTLSAYAYNLDEGDEE